MGNTVSEGTTPEGVAYRVEWDEQARPTRLVVAGEDHDITGLRRYRGSGVFVECAAGTLRISQLPQLGATSAWITNEDQPEPGS